MQSVPQLARGEYPEDFYLIEEDYYTGDEEVPENVSTLRVICRFISYLKKLAPYSGQMGPRGHLGLMFVQPANDAPKPPVVIETLVDNELLADASALNPRLAEELASSEPSTDPHYNSRIGVFGVTLSEFINKRPVEVSSFRYLVKHWGEFVGAYNNDLATYLSGFAFHKAKREVAEAEFDIASRYAKVVSDINGKLFTIPLSLAAIAALPKAVGVFQSEIIVLGLLLAAIIVSNAIENQTRHFGRVKHAKEVVIGALEGKKSEYPDDLRNAIEDMTKQLNNNERALKGMLLFFKVAGWLPVIAATSYCVFNFTHL